MIFYFDSVSLNIILVLSFLLFISSFLTDHVLSEQENVIIKNDNLIINKFEDKYMEEVKKINERELTDDQLSQLKYSIVLENTPMGNIVMYYDQDTEMFSYYSDRREIPYKYLDVIARKYVKVFDCKMIYTLIEDELEASKKKLEDVKEKNNIQIEIKKKEKEKEKEKKKDIFAAYKNYNIKSDQPVKDEDYLIKENINKFKRIGLLKDYQFVKGKKGDGGKYDADDDDNDDDDADANANANANAYADNGGKKIKKELTYQDYVASQNLSLEK